MKESNFSESKFLTTNVVTIVRLVFGHIAYYDFHDICFKTIVLWWISTVYFEILFPREDAIVVRDNENNVFELVFSIWLWSFSCSLMILRYAINGFHRILNLWQMKDGKIFVLSKYKYLFVRKNDWNIMRLKNIWNIIYFKFSKGFDIIRNVNIRSLSFFFPVKPKNAGLV